jgi:hypothetical protein
VNAKDFVLLLPHADGHFSKATVFFPNESLHDS